MKVCSLLKNSTSQLHASCLDWTVLFKKQRVSRIHRLLQPATAQSYGVVPFWSCIVRGIHHSSTCSSSVFLPPDFRFMPSVGIHLHHRHLSPSPIPARGISTPDETQFVRAPLTQAVLGGRCVTRWGSDPSETSASRVGEVRGIEWGDPLLRWVRSEGREHPGRQPPHKCAHQPVLHDGKGQAKVHGQDESDETSLGNASGYLLASGPGRCSSEAKENETNLSTRPTGMALSSHMTEKCSDSNAEWKEKHRAQTKRGRQSNRSINRTYEAIEGKNGRGRGACQPHTKIERLFADRDAFIHSFDT